MARQTHRVPRVWKKCWKCGRQNNLEKMCLSNPLTRPPSGETNGMYDAYAKPAAFVELCTVTMASSDNKLHTLPLDHHLYNDMCDKWMKHVSTLQPYVNLTLTTEREDY